MRSPDTSALGRVLLVLRQPLAGAMAIGLLASVGVVQGLQHRLESDGRERMRDSLVLLNDSLSARTVHAEEAGVASIMGLNEPILKEAALGGRELDDPEVLKRLAIVRRHFGYEGLYVGDKRGLVVANDTDGKKSTGTSLLFRPYFRQAMQGQGSFYAAVGTDSESRGLYYAAPLYESTDRHSGIIGVIAIKASADFLDGLLREPGSDNMLLSPQGIVFAATRPEWMWAMTPPLDEARVREIRDLRQFGVRFENADPAVLGFDPARDDVRLNGERFAVERTALDLKDPQGPWTLVKLSPASAWFPLASRLKIAIAVWLLALLVGVWLQRQRAFRVEANKKLAAETADREQAERAVLEAARREASIAELHAAMRGAESFEDLGRVYFSGLAAQTGMRYGLLYVADAASRTLTLCGGYGDAVANAGTPIAYGHGLAGQCALDRQAIRLEPLPEDYVRIVSGTGGARPSYLLLRPLIVNKELVAVIELAGLGELSEPQLDVLRQLEPVAADCVGLIERKRLYRDALMKQLAFQQALIDSIPNPIFYKGADTRFLGCNLAYERAFNVRKQDFVGKRVLDLEYLPYAERLAYQKQDEEVLANQSTVKRVVTLPYADGKLRNCLYWVRGFSLDDGTRTGLVGTFIELDVDGIGDDSPHETVQPNR